MMNDFPNKIKINNGKLNNSSNFIKLNSIMNQRLIGLVDYLKASIYFSHYNDKNTKKNKRNLEQFFKNKIFKKNPFSTPSLKNSLISNFPEKRKNDSPLNIVVNFKNNKMIFQKNKYSTPYDLHSKKHNFFKNMVVFSKYMHNESKIENDFRKKYPKIESFPINNNYINYKKNLPLTPKIPRAKLSIKIDGFTSTYDDKSSFFKNSKKKIKKRFKNIKTFLSFDNRNEKNENLNNIFNNKSSNFFNDSNNRIKRYYTRNKTIKSIKKANCYYNNLHLKKLSQNLLKYTYLNEE